MVLYGPENVVYCLNKQLFPLYNQYVIIFLRKTGCEECMCITPEETGNEVTKKKTGVNHRRIYSLS